MRCRRCGRELYNVPEHLRELAEWVCQECTNAAPRRGSLNGGGQTVHQKVSKSRKTNAA